MDPKSAIYAVKKGKASEYEIAIGRYQKKDGTVYFNDSGISSTEHDVDEMNARISMGGLDAKRSLTWVVDFHSHSDDRSPGLSGDDGFAYQHGYNLVFGTDRVSLPLEFSGAFYAKQQIFYGWTAAENVTLTFDEMRNALK